MSTSEFCGRGPVQLLTIRNLSVAPNPAQQLPPADGEKGKSWEVSPKTSSGWTMITFPKLNPHPTLDPPPGP